MPPKQAKKPTQSKKPTTTAYYPRVKGHGVFKASGGRPWTSHHASVRYKVALDGNGDLVGDVKAVRHYGQLPRSGGGGGNQYAKPFFKSAEQRTMKARALKAAIDAFTSDQYEVPRPLELRKDDPKHEQRLCELCKVLGFPCTGVLVDVEGNRVKISAKVLKARKARLEKGPVEVLYHQTDRASATAIVQSQQMKRGGGGSLGGGIYFAESAAATDRKALHRGVVLKAKVRLGNPKKLGSADSSINFAKLLEEGYDSVIGTFFPSGAEYVVYNSDQVSDITVHRR